MEKRQNHDRFMAEAFAAAEKTSRCIRKDRQVGVAAVLDGKIILTAANGPHRAVTACDSKWGECMRKRLDIIQGDNPGLSWCICAEQRLVCAAARDGISLCGATMYCTHKPCFICTKLFAECGVAEVFYKIDYPNEYADMYAKESGLKITSL